MLGWMGFVAAGWLIALVPWTVLTLWLLTGHHERAAVPFLKLWRGEQRAPRTRARLHRPPLALVCLLAAMLLSVLAAARPRLHIIPYSTGPKATLIVDRGITMSARGQSQPRYIEAAQLARMPIMSRFGFGPTELILVPDGPPIECDRLDFFMHLNQNPPPPTDTRAVLSTIVARVLQASDWPVVLLSDQHLNFDDPRLLQIAPQTTPRNVGIVRAAARNVPSPQLMLRLRNDSPFASPIVRLSIDGTESLVSIELPPPGTEGDRFIDLPKPARRIEVELRLDDDILADNRATLALTESWPRIDAAADLPDEVRRMIATYTKLRPPGADAPAVNVTMDHLPEAAPGAVVSSGPHPVSSDNLEVQDHPINTSVDWRKSLGNATAGPAPGSRWRPIVSRGPDTLVAVRELPARQVFVGFSSETFGRTSDFVIFWTNALDWLGGGGENWRVSLTQAIPVTPPPDTGWAEKLYSLPISLRRGVDLAPGLLLLAVTLVLIALAAWGRPRVASSAPPGLQ
jgi:hypothetical protein